MSPSGHTTLKCDVDHVDRSRTTSNAGFYDTVLAHISLQESTSSASRVPRDVDGLPSNITHHPCSVTEAGPADISVTHHMHAHPTEDTNSMSITCGMSVVYRALLILNTIFNISLVASPSNGSHQAEYQTDNRRFVTSKLTVEETRSVSDFDNTFGECNEQQCPTPDRTSTSPGISSAWSPTWSESGDRNIPGYYQFFDNAIEYQDLIGVLAPNVMHIVRDPLVWAYTRDFARRTRSLSPDEQAAGFLDFIDTRSNIPEFRDKLSTVLEARSDLKGFLRK